MRHFLVTALLSGLLAAAGPNMTPGNAETKGSMMETSEHEFIFRNFPERGRILEATFLEEADREAAQAYYEELFLGKPVSAVRAAFEHDQKLFQQGKHNVITLNWGDSETTDYLEKGQYWVYYDYPMRDPKHGIVLLAYGWDVEFNANDSGTVTKIEVTPLFLAP